MAGAGLLGSAPARRPGQSVNKQGRQPELLLFPLASIPDIPSDISPHIPPPVLNLVFRENASPSRGQR